MIKLLQVVVLLVCFSSCAVYTTRSNIAEPLLIDLEYLKLTKQRIRAEDPAVMAAFQQLITEAETALTQGPYTVVNKEVLPPSKDKHDYASYSRYWWPDPTQPDGLPYIRKDGETNPASQNTKISDRQTLGALGADTETLGLAYYFTDDKRYASKAAELIRIWFLDPTTRMNPNLNHAQCRQGHNEGSKTGVLDGRIMVQALESSLLIAKSAALGKSELAELKAWVTEYFSWLTTDEMALAAAAATNNHGSFYDAQAMYFALYSDNEEAAKTIALQVEQKRILSQIAEDGSMPEEQARTRPLFYSMYNMHALMLTAHLASRVGVDVWKARSKDSRLKAALDYLVPYADPAVQWSEPTIKEADRLELFMLLKMGADVYDDSIYRKAMKKLPADRRAVHLAVLAYPMMR